jgi:endonuclease YncB( thermonuclease family)
MLALSASSAVAAPPVYCIDHLTDGDTVVLRNGQRVRLVQIDTPEVFFGRECHGRAAYLADENAATRHTGTPLPGARD